MTDQFSRREASGRRLPFEIFVTNRIDDPPRSLMNSVEVIYEWCDSGDFHMQKAEEMGSRWCPLSQYSKHYRVICCEPMTLIQCSALRRRPEKHRIDAQRFAVGECRRE